MVRTKRPTIRRTKTTNITPATAPKPSTTNGRGRPPLYTSPEQMQIQIDDYFDSCWDTTTKRHYNPDGTLSHEEHIKKQTRPYTITGLAYWLGMSRVALLDYQHDKPDFLATIMKAKQKCELYAEENLYMGKASTYGVIFAMTNNFTRWNNTQRKEMTGPNGEPLGIGVDIRTNDEKAKERREQMLKELGA